MFLFAYSINQKGSLKLAIMADIVTSPREWIPIPKWVQFSIKKFDPENITWQLNNQVCRFFMGLKSLLTCPMWAREL